ncbi:hypothetical protein COLU111180_20340 [Cohnella lubricantis]|uniref:Uncharacterized protein n=1 Tax=Cohnella lubricantis TaxID=2163172 RepID=A0A841TIZ4_9BACL|nr:hypothetical protein [Cohnella lubricantis]MBB6679180.1 hypothetical protein [Cohnella lubricantis]MBP2120164.1 hypothetical protein [Cohnella lubricantis]
MPRSRSAARRTRPRRRSDQAQLSLTAKSKARAFPAAVKKRPAANASKVRLHQSNGSELQTPPVRRIPWWVFPEHERAIAPSDSDGSARAVGSPSPGQSLMPPPAPPSRITIWISGGFAFPQVTRPVFAPYSPGMTIRQALARTGLIAFGPEGYMIAVSGVPVGGRVNARIQYNGYVVPAAMLDAPAEPNSTMLVELFYINADNF